MITNYLILNTFTINQHYCMKKGIFKALSKFNQKVLPSYSKKELDLTKANKAQLAIIGWKLWVTKNALD
tara:strand:- start:51215 stop:51421 length:207 start_codon:yes stop_codon:yes gene_type:complete